MKASFKGAIWDEFSEQHHAAPKHQKQRHI
jgi:hypothetical protein